MNPQIVDKPAFTAVGVRITTEPKSNEISQLWQQHGERLMEVEHVAESNAAYGVMEMTNTQLTYMAAMSVTKADDIPEGMTSWEIPAATYAVVETTLPDIGKAFDYLNGEWMPANGYKHGDSPDFEYYGPEFSPHEPTSKLSVYIPIKGFPKK